MGARMEAAFGQSRVEHDAVEQCHGVALSSENRDPACVGGIICKSARKIVIFRAFYLSHVSSAMREAAQIRYENIFFQNEVNILIIYINNPGRSLFSCDLSGEGCGEVLRFSFCGSMVFSGSGLLSGTVVADACGVFRGLGSGVCVGSCFGVGEGGRGGGGVGVGGIGVGEREGEGEEDGGGLALT